MIGDEGLVGADQLLAAGLQILARLRGCARSRAGSVGNSSIWLQTWRGKAELLAQKHLAAVSGRPTTEHQREKGVPKDRMYSCTESVVLLRDTLKILS